MHSHDVTVKSLKSLKNWQKDAKLDDLIDSLWGFTIEFGRELR